MYWSRGEVVRAIVLGTGLILAGSIVISAVALVLIGVII